MRGGPDEFIGSRVIVDDQECTLYEVSWAITDDRFSVILKFDDERSMRLEISREVMRFSGSIQEAIDLTIGKQRKNKYNDPLKAMEDRQRARGGVGGSRAKFKLAMNNGVEYIVDGNGYPVDFKDLTIYELRDMARMFGVSRRKLEEILFVSRRMARALKEFERTMESHNIMKQFNESAHKFYSNVINVDAKLNSRDADYIIGPPPAHVNPHSDIYCVFYYDGIDDPEDVPGSATYYERVLNGDVDLMYPQLRTVAAETEEEAWAAVDEIIDNGDGLPVTVSRGRNPIAYRTARGSGPWVANGPDVKLPDGL